MKLMMIIYFLIKIFPGEKNKGSGLLQENYKRWDVMKKLRKIKIKANERVFITGKTRSGKSYFMQNILLPQYSNWVLYDYKHEVNMPGAEFFYSLTDFKKKPNLPQIIYRPLTGTDEEFNELCKQVYFRGSNTLILDEVANHCNGHIVPFHDLIMRLGASKGVGIINLTQRPRGIHNNVISMCEHYFVFQLPMLTDRKKMADICGPEVLEMTKDYQYWYYNFCLDAAIKMPAI